MLWQLQNRVVDADFCLLQEHILLQKVNAASLRASSFHALETQLLVLMRHNQEILIMNRLFDRQDAEYDNLDGDVRL